MTALPSWVESAMFDAQRDPRPVAPNHLAVGLDAAMRDEPRRVGDGELSGGPGRPRHYNPITTGESRVKVNRATVGKPEGARRSKWPTERTAMASRKQTAARKRFARQAKAKGETKVGKAAASRTRRKRKR